MTFFLIFYLKNIKRKFIDEFIFKFFEYFRKKILLKSFFILLFKKNKNKIN